MRRKSLIKHPTRDSNPQPSDVTPRRWKTLQGRSLTRYHCASPGWILDVGIVRVVEGNVRAEASFARLWLSPKFSTVYKCSPLRCRHSVANQTWLIRLIMICRSRRVSVAHVRTRLQEEEMQSHGLKHFESRATTPCNSCPPCPLRGRSRLGREDRDKGRSSIKPKECRTKRINTRADSSSYFISCQFLLTQDLCVDVRDCPRTSVPKPAAKINPNDVIKSYNLVTTMSPLATSYPEWRLELHGRMQCC
jgi:hypothetical protein